MSPVLTSQALLPLSTQTYPERDAEGLVSSRCGCVSMVLTSGDAQGSQGVTLMRVHVCAPGEGEAHSMCEAGMDDTEFQVSLVYTATCLL